MFDADAALAAARAMMEGHERIALECSGGRDSLALVHLLRPELDRITVFWLNTGAAFPETVKAMERVRQLAPHFVEVQGNQPQVIAEFGIPTDILPRSATPIGMFAGQSTSGLLMQDSYSCCARVVMVPLHKAVMEFGASLVIRGQKLSDRHKSPVRSGDVIDGVRFLFPLEGWEAEDVMTFLRSRRVPIPRFYDTMGGAPDCMTCTGWWSENHGQYLKRHHPEAHATVQAGLRAIMAETMPHIENFNRELEQE